MHGHTNIKVSYGLLSDSCPSIWHYLRSCTQQTGCCGMSHVPQWLRTPEKRRKIDFVLLLTNNIPLNEHMHIYQAIIATSVHRLYIRPPGKNSLELLRQYNLFITAKTVFCRSQWPLGLRRRSTATRLLRSWVQIPPGGMDVCLLCVVR
jgi:hypothetical protein